MFKETCTNDVQPRTRLQRARGYCIGLHAIASTCIGRARTLMLKLSWSSTRNIHSGDQRFGAIE